MDNEGNLTLVRKLVTKCIQLDERRPELSLFLVKSLRLLCATIWSEYPYHVGKRKAVFQMKPLH